MNYPCITSDPEFYDFIDIELEGIERARVELAEFELCCKIYVRAVNLMMKRFELMGPTKKQIDFVRRCIAVFQKHERKGFASHLSSALNDWCEVSCESI